MERFLEILAELSHQVGLDLYRDRKGACLLRFEDKIEVQIECDSNQQNLILSTLICEIPPGKFRENILKDALKANAPFPVNGTLAYSDRDNKLVLFTTLSCTELTGKKFADFLTLFVEKAMQWHQGVETGNTSHLIPLPQKSTGNIFGLK